MKISNVLVVYRKELLDMLRDRRTVFSTLVFPLVAFPLMTVGFGTLERRVSERVKTEAATIMLLGEEHGPELAQTIREAEGFAVVPTSSDYRQQISDKQLRAAVEFPSEFERLIKAGGDVPALKIYYYDTEIRSESAARRLEEVIRDYREAVVEARLAAQGLSPAILKPVETKEENVAAAEKVGGRKLANLMPYFIIIFCLVGALHPAMDLTAGEKERGTLETILASSVRRVELVLGKFLLVLTASLTTAIASLSSFSLTMLLSKDYLEEMTRGYAYTVSAKAVASVWLLVLPLAILFSGALVTISLFAKSYKEAQSYTGPLMILAIVPAVVGMLPGVELNPKLALIPIVNVSLVSKEILTGSFPWASMTIVFVSTCVYAAAALFVAVKAFQRESVLFRS